MLFAFLLSGDLSQLREEKDAFNQLTAVAIARTAENKAKQDDVERTRDSLAHAHASHLQQLANKQTAIEAVILLPDRDAALIGREQFDLAALDTAQTEVLRQWNALAHSPAVVSQAQQVRAFIRSLELVRVAELLPSMPMDKRAALQGFIGEVSLVRARSHTG